MSERKVIDPETWPWYDHKRYSFCMAAQKEDYLFLSGNTASEFDPETKSMVCKGDIVDQAIVNYEKIKLIMETAGGTMDDIVKMVDYVTPTGAAPYAKLDEARAKYFSSGYRPAGTSFVVNKLFRPDAFLEVECIAALGGGPKKVINPGWSDYTSDGYQNAILKGNMLVISGQVGMDHSTGKLVGSDLSSQTDQAYKNIQVILDAAGGTFGDIVKTIHYISPAGFAQFKDNEDIRAKYFKDSYSAHTETVVNQNIPSDALVKVDCIAVVGDAKKEMVDLGLSQPFATRRPLVRKGTLVSLSGLTGVDMQTGKLVEGNIADQQRQILVNAEKLLGAANLGWGDLLMTVDFVAPDGVADYRATGKVRHEFFQGVLPPSTGVCMDHVMGPDGTVFNVDFTAGV